MTTLKSAKTKPQQAGFTLFHHPRGCYARGQSRYLFVRWGNNYTHAPDGPTAFRKLIMDSLLKRTTLLTRPEVAEILRLKVATIKAKTARGEISSVKMGRAVRYRPEDVYRYIVEHTRETSKTSSASLELDNSP